MQDLKENRIEYLQGLSDWFKNNEHDLIINLSFVCFWHMWLHDNAIFLLHSYTRKNGSAIHATSQQFSSCT